MISSKNTRTFMLLQIILENLEYKIVPFQKLIVIVSVRSFMNKIFLFFISSSKPIAWKASLYCAFSYIGLIYTLSLGQKVLYMLLRLWGPCRVWYMCHWPSRIFQRDQANLTALKIIHILYIQAQEEVILYQVIK